MLNLDNFLTVRQVAFILKIHHLTVRRYIKEGKIKASRIGGSVRIKESALQESSKEFSTIPRSPVFKNRSSSVKIFSEYDPILRFKGVGVSLKLSR